MTLPVSQIIKGLQRHGQALAKLKRPDVGSASYFEWANVIAGAIDILARCRGPKAVREWIDRKPYREKLLRSQRACLTVESRKAVGELLNWAETTLDADESFRPTIDPGNLPLPATTTRKLSDEHKAALVAGRQRVREEATARLKRRRDWETEKRVAQ